MVSCSYCSEEILGKFPFKCSHCEKHFCSEHHLPEHHDCAAFQAWNEEQIKKFREGKGPILHPPDTKTRPVRKKTDDLPEYILSPPDAIQKIKCKDISDREINIDKRGVYFIAIVLLLILVLYYLYT